MGKRVIYFFAAAFLSSSLIVTPSSACDTVCPLRHASPWDRLVEKSFGLPKGLGTVLMTLEEWEEEKKIMVGMTPQERQLYKNSMHLKLTEKAREKGIALSRAGSTKREVKKQKDIVRPFVYSAKSNGPVTE